MKNFITCLIFIFTTDLFGACSSPIARDNFQQGDVVSSTKINQDFDGLYAHFNNFNGDCIDSFSIREGAIQDEAITAEKIQDGTVSASKFASGVIPTYSVFSRVRVFTASGTYQKPANVEKILVQVVGGGGALTSDDSGNPVRNGGASSFGAHCTAGGGGGSHSITNVYGAGGSASGGDINLVGRPATWGGHKTLLGEYGQGGDLNRLDGRETGGNGGYCAKLIDKSQLGDFTTVVVGSGGQFNSSSGGPQSGKNGIVVIQEFTR